DLFPTPRGSQPEFALFPYTTLFRSDHFAHAFKLTLRRLSCPAPINAKWQQTGREKNQGNHGELPIHQEQNDDCAYNRHRLLEDIDRKSTRLNSSHVSSSYAVFCWKK